MDLVDDLGLSFRFLAAPQVEGGGLQGKRVFVLPYSTALSDREVTEIRRFVEQGGLLLADAAAGLFDEHVAWRETGALDALFGIEARAPRERLVAGPRAGGVVSLTPEGSRLGLRAGELGGLEALEPELRARDGRPLVHVGASDLAVGNRLGKGRVVYLNALVDKQDASRNAWRSVLRALLADAGVRPAVAVTGAAGRPVARVRVVRYRFGAHEVIALLDGRLDAKTSFSRDGVTVYEDAEQGRVVRHDVDVSLPRTAHVTNARSGEDLGTTGRLRTTLTAGDALVLALGPEREALRLEGPQHAKRGVPAFFEVSPAPVSRRLLRYEVHGPDGGFRPEYAQVLDEDGACVPFVLPSALNDPAGAYRVRVTERQFLKAGAALAAAPRCSRQPTCDRTCGKATTSGPGRRSSIAWTRDRSASSRTRAGTRSRRRRRRPSRVRNPGLGLVGYTWEENGPALAAREGRETLEQSVAALAALPFVDVLYIRCDWRDVQSRPGTARLPGVGGRVASRRAATACGSGSASAVESGIHLDPVALPDFLLPKVPWWRSSAAVGPPTRSGSSPGTTIPSTSAPSGS